MSSPSLVIRNGTIVDGSGEDPYEADLAVTDGKVTAIGGNIPKGAEEINARGRLVTPGFVDVHTHYDAQVTWSREHPDEKYPEFFVVNVWFGGETRVISVAERLTEKQANSLMMALQTQVLQAAEVSDDGELHVRPVR